MTQVMHCKETVLNSDDKQLSNLCTSFYEHWGPSSKRGMQQCYEEMYFLKRIIGNRKFNKMFEIGVDDGGTAWVYANLFGAPESTYYACDIDMTPNITGISEKTKSLSNVNIIPLHMSCRDCDLQNFDFVHIDGYHSYEDVSGDFDHFWPKIIPGGLCILHDTYLWPGCIQFRQQVEKSYDCISIKGHSLLSGNFGLNIPHGHKPGTGITIVFKN